MIKEFIRWNAAINSYLHNSIESTWLIKKRFQQHWERWPPLDCNWSFLCCLHLKHKAMNKSWRVHFWSLLGCRTEMILRRKGFPTNDGMLGHISCIPENGTQNKTHSRVQRFNFATRKEELIHCMCFLLLLHRKLLMLVPRALPIRCTRTKAAWRSFSVF